jgi:hypothetical protein
MVIKVKNQLSRIAVKIETELVFWNWLLTWFDFGGKKSFKNDLTHQDITLVFGFILWLTLSIDFVDKFTELFFFEVVSKLY